MKISGARAITSPQAVAVAAARASEGRPRPILALLDFSLFRPFVCKSLCLKHIFNNILSIIISLNSYTALY